MNTISKKALFGLLFIGIWIMLFSAYTLTNRSDIEKNRRLNALLSTDTGLVLGVAVKSSNCQTNRALPDPLCTPGAVFTDATEAQICVEGYTKTVRNVSAKLKKAMYAAYDVSYPVQTGRYEIDHLIPLALGGNNDAANLWPESAEPAPGFKEKDLVENYLHEEVCASRVPLKIAQEQIAHNWVRIYGNLSPAKISDLKSRYKSWTN